MLRLIKNYSELQVNSVGFIEKWTLDDAVSVHFPVYIVFFKDHSQVDPTCHHLETSSMASNLQFDDKQSVLFHKTIGDNFTESSIRISENCIRWRIEIKGKYLTGFRFGVVYPTYNNASIFSDKKEIETPISNYFHMLARSFRNQTTLDVPLLTVRQKDKCISFFCSLDMSVQFFHNIDDNNIRITTSTNVTNCFEIFILRHKELQDGKRVFLETYPEAAPILNRWEQLLERVQSKYKAKIRYHHEDGQCESHGKKYTYCNPCDSKIEEYCMLLEQEMSKYPSDFFEQLDINGMLLVANMKMECDGQIYDIHGAIFYDQLLLDVNNPNVWVIHHEICHCLENQLRYELWPGGNYSLFEAKWAVIDNRWPQSDLDVEFRCNLFSWLMINRQEVDQQCLANPLLNKQVQILIKKMGNLIDFPRVSELKDTRLIYCVDDDKIQTIPFGQLDRNKLYLSSPEKELIDELLNIRN